MEIAQAATIADAAQAQMHTFFRVLIAAIVLAMTGLILYRPAFGIIDDHLIVAHQDRGHFGVPVCVNPDSRRFFPMDGQEYWLISGLGPLTAFKAYVFNAVQFCLFATILWFYLRKDLSPGWTVFAIVALVMSSASMMAWLRLLVPERGVLFFIVIALFCIDRFNSRWSIWYAIVSICSIGLALFYKEPVFLMTGTYAVLKLIGLYMDRDTGVQRYVATGIFCLSILFAVIAGSYFLLFSHTGSVSYAAQRRFMPTVQNAVFVVRHNAVIAHPLVFFILIPLTFARVIRTVIDRDIKVITAEPELFAASAYVFAILVLNLPPTPYYLLPVYAFGIRPIWNLVRRTICRSVAIPTIIAAVAVALLCMCFPMGIVVRALDERIGRAMLAGIVLVILASVLYVRWPKASRQVSICVGLLLLFVNTIPDSLNVAWQWKGQPVAFQEAIRTTANLIRARPAESRSNVFVVGAPRVVYVEAYTSVGRYLEDELAGTPFDLFSELPPEPRFVADPAGTWSVERTSDAAIPRTGDILIKIPDASMTSPEITQNASLISQSKTATMFKIPTADSVQAAIKTRWKPPASPVQPSDGYEVFEMR